MSGFLVAEAVGVKFGEKRALSGVSFSVEKPSLVCVLGPNGAGKTTLFEVLTGMRKATEGRIRLFGEEASPAHFPKRRVGVVLQKEFVLDEVRTGEYAELFAAIYRQKQGQSRILKDAHLEDKKSVSVARLSGGEAQRLFIAAACVHDPEMLFLDEPTSDLDPKSREEVGATLKALSKKTVILMTTHDLAEAEAIADAVLFLVRGEVVAYGSLDEVKKKADATSLRDAFFKLLPHERAADAAEIA